MPANSHPIRIATRGSALALAQANTVLAQCQQAFPELTFELTVIKTTGDQQLTASLASSDLPKGLFTKEIESALIDREADLAVHSLKDLPTDLPSGLILGAVGQRVDARDVLVWQGQPKSDRPQSSPSDVVPQSISSLPEVLLDNLAILPQGSTVATSSTRRAAQLLEKRPDLQIVPVRGNVGTRLRKLAEQTGFSATLLAAAGLGRLQYQVDPTGTLLGPGVPAGLQAAPLSLEQMLPCVGQAALGIEIRENDPTIAAVCAKLNHEPTQHCVAAERAFLKELGGGCHLAVAAYAAIQDHQLYMQAISFLQGAAVRTAGSDKPANAESLGRQLAHNVMS